MVIKPEGYNRAHMFCRDMAIRDALKDYPKEYFNFKKFHLFWSLNRRQYMHDQVKKFSSMGIAQPTMDEMIRYDNEKPIERGMIICFLTQLSIPLGASL